LAQKSLKLNLVAETLNPAKYNDPAATELVPEATFPAAKAGTQVDSPSDAIGPRQREWHNGRHPVNLRFVDKSAANPSADQHREQLVL